jgi:hypothetical protein
MEPECLLPYLQVPTTCPYPEPTPSSPHDPPPNFLKIHLNIILPSTSWSPHWPLFLRLSHQHPVELTNIQFIINPASSSETLSIKTVKIRYTQVSNSVKPIPSWQADVFRNQSRDLPYFMEPGGLLPRSQDTAAFFYSEPYLFIPLHNTLFM